MKQFVKTFVIAASTNFILFWISWVLLMIALPPISAWQFFGFTPTPPPTIWQNSVMFAFEALSAPMSLIYEVVHHDSSILLFVLLSLTNSIVWGLCVSFPICVIRRRFVTSAA
jgi:hypothetical protein